MPVLARVQPGFVLRLNRDEADNAFEVPLAFLMAPQNHKRESRELEWAQPQPRRQAIRQPQNLGRDSGYPSESVRTGVSRVTGASRRWHSTIPVGDVTDSVLGIPNLAGFFRVSRHRLQCACGSADLFQRREGRWREDLVADACDDGSIALAVVADLVPSRIILECRPPRLAICKRLPREHVG